MSLQTSPSPLPRGKRVVLLADAPESGGTLGWYGYVDSVCDLSRAFAPNKPWLWKYRVFVPRFREFRDVVAEELFFVPGDELYRSERSAACIVRFDAVVGPDDPAIKGSYCAPPRLPCRFAFEKHDGPVATFDFHMPLETPSRRPLRLCYRVPQSAVLDRQYVLRAIGELTGIDSWQVGALS